MPRITPLDAAIIAGALLATLGLVFIATSSLHGFFSADPPAPSREQKASSSARLAVLDDVTTARAAHSHAEPAKGEPKGQSVVTTAGPNDRRNPTPEATLQASRPPMRSSLTVPQEASGPRATPARGDDRPKIVAVPETRPTTLPGWSIRDVTGNTAVLEGPNGVWSASPGATVPGVGRVHFVVRWGNRWIVGTSKGLITTR